MAASLFPVMGYSRCLLSLFDAKIVTHFSLGFTHQLPGFAAAWYT